MKTIPALQTSLKYQINGPPKSLSSKAITHKYGSGNEAVPVARTISIITGGAVRIKMAKTPDRRATILVSQRSI